MRVLRWVRDGKPETATGTRAEVQALRDYLWGTYRIVAEVRAA